MSIPSSPPPIIPSRPMSRVRSPVPFESHQGQSINQQRFPQIDNLMNDTSNDVGRGTKAEEHNDKDRYLKYFDGVSTEIPEFFHELSTNKLDDLLERNEILRGHLLMNPKFQELKDEVIPILDEQKSKLKELQRYYGDEINVLVERSNVELKKVSELLSSWRSLQVEMYAELETYQKPAILEQLHKKITLNDSKCSEIANTFINSKVDPTLGGLVDSDHDEEVKIKKFIKDYRSQRQAYYLSKEKYYRLNEDRVGGII